MIERCGIGASCDALPFIRIFWSEVIVVCYAVAVDVVVHCVAQTVVVHVRGDAGCVEWVGTAQRFIGVGESIVVVVKIPHVAEPIVVEVQGDVGGIQRVTHAVQFIDVLPSVVVVVAVVGVEQTIAVGVKSKVGVLFNIFIVVSAESQTSGQHQEQDHHDGKTFLHDLTHKKLGINMFPAFIHIG